MDRSAFAAYGATVSAPVKRMRAAAQKRALAKVAVEKQKLSKLWVAWRAERREKILSGPHGAAARELLDLLDVMPLGGAGDLVALVEAGPWRQADADTRFEILSLIDAAIIGAREAAKLEPFDDPLPGAPKCARRARVQKCTSMMEPRIAAPPLLGR